MPFGLVPARYKSGAPYNGSDNRYFVDTTEANNIYIGDPVIISGTGDVNGVPGCVRAGAGDRITGVVVGFGAKPGATAGTQSAINRGYRVGGEADYLLVSDDPSLLFYAQEDGIGGFLTTASIGLNVNLIPGAGSNFTKKSGYMLDSSTAATTSAQVRIWGLDQTVNNTFGTTSSVWLVSLVTTTESPAAGTTGV